jgi:hypothetical protein
MPPIASPIFLYGRRAATLTKDISGGRTLALPSDASGDLEADLRRIAALLRDAGHLTPEAQASLASLVDDLAGAVRKPAGDSAAASHVAATAAHLLDALVQEQDQGILGSARDRLERTVMSAETQAPLAAGVARRLLEILASIGI